MVKSLQHLWLLFLETISKTKSDFAGEELNVLNCDNKNVSSATGKKKKKTQEDPVSHFASNLFFSFFWPKIERAGMSTDECMITFFIFQSQFSLGVSQMHHSLKHGWIASLTTLLVNCSLLQLSNFLEPENYYFGKPLTLMTMCSFLHKLVDWTFFSDVNLNVSSRKEGCKFGLWTNKPIIKCSNYYYNTIIIWFS